jgi:hypothetical protein
MKMRDLHSDLQNGIINYLSVHPSALATVADISANWLANEKVEHNVAQVQTAVDRLVDQGELFQRLGGDFYSR